MAEPEADEAVHDAGTLYSASVIENARVMRALLGSTSAGPSRTPCSSRDGDDPDRRRCRRRDARRSPCSRRRRSSAPTTVDRFTHGTTIATNALLERRGARTAFVTTEGFEHVLHLRRQTRAHLYRPCAEHSAPLVPLERCVGVSERMGPDGELAAARPRLARRRRRRGDRRLPALLVPRTRARARRRGRAPSPAPGGARRRLARGGARVPRVRARLDDGRRRLPRPGARPLPARARRRLRGRRVFREPLVMRSSGGLATLEEAAASRRVRAPLRPGRRRRRRGAARRARRASRTRSRSTWAARRPTSARSSTARRAASTSARVGGLPVRLPTLAVHTVGAGGGSIVWRDEGGALRVGPESAGADPGPACYGQGGRRATVTDANLLLGRLPERLAGGIELDRRRGRARARRARPGRGDRRRERRDGARAARRLRRAGARPARLRARRLRRRRAAARVRARRRARDEHRARSRRRPASSPRSASSRPTSAATHVRSYVVPLEEAGELPAEGEADLRYAGQSFELTVAARPATSPSAFHAAHEARYGYADASSRDRARRRAHRRRAPAPPLDRHRARRAPSTGPRGSSSTARPPGSPRAGRGETDAHGTLVLRRRA